MAGTTLHEMYKEALIDEVDDVDLEIADVDANEDGGNERVGGDYDWYGAQAVESDDDEGEVVAFEAEQGIAFGGDALDDLDAEINEELYGLDEGGMASYIPDVKGSLEQRLEASGFEPVIGVISGCFNPAMVLSSGAPDAVKSFFSTMKAGDIQELAAQLAVAPGFANWQELPKEAKVKMVEGAVWSSVLPGIDMAWDDAFLKTWQDNEASNYLVRFLKSGASAVSADVTQDMPSAVMAAMQEIPGLAALIENTYHDQPDELLNGLAFSYWILAKIGRQDVYAWIADNVDRQASAIFPLVGVPPETGTSSTTAPPMIDILPPLGLSRGPRPQDILAGGVVVMNLLALLGVK